jgi:hypothetical protein
LYPASIPATKEDLAVSQIVARQALALAVRNASRDFPQHAVKLKSGLLPVFEPIIAGGGALSDTAGPGAGLMLLLDALQPVGVTTFILDQNKLLPLLGAAASRNSLLPVQVLESGAFLSVGTVVMPVVSAAYGTPILKARMTYEDGTEARVDVKLGSIEMLPLQAGQTAKLNLTPLHHSDVGFGPGRGGTIPVSGGALGVVFDGRGRPINLPDDPVRRRELIKKWHWTLGEQ